MTRALILILALPLAGCPALDIIENKPSPYKAAHEQRMALVTPVVASAAEPVIEPVAFVEPEPIAIPEPEPECVSDEWRVYRCNDGEMFDWWNGEPI